MTEALRQRWEEWRGLLDAEALRVSYSAPQGVVVGAFLAVFGLVGSEVPHVRELLGVDGVAFAVGVAPAWLASMALVVVFQRDAVFGTRGLLAMIAGAAVVMYEAGCLVAFAGERAAPALAGLVALTALAHANQCLSSARYPFVFVADVVGLAAAALHARSGAHLVALGVGGIGGVTAGLLVGEATIRSIRARKRNEAMRAALESNIAARRSARTTELEGMVLDARARRHDIRNALTSALIDLEFIVRGLLEKRQLDEAADVRGVLDTLEGALQFAAQHQPGSSQREPIAIVEPIAAIVQRAGRRASGVTIRLHVDAGEPLVAHVEGGAVGLRRIVENLITNACEGDGTSHASRVVLRLQQPAGSSLVAIEVTDDGPGFSAAQLAAPIEGFVTTKQGGTGLGLFTVQNLSVASGGSVQRRNGPDGGACVTVLLPARLPEEGANGE